MPLEAQLETRLDHSKQWSASDTRHMARAVELAAEAAASGEAPIGAVIVDPVTDEVIAEGANCPIAQHDPTAHAEIVALREAATRLGNYRLTGLSMYVSLEPCAMCAGAISHARIGRLVVGAADSQMPFATLVEARSPLTLDVVFVAPGVATLPPSELGPVLAALAQGYDAPIDVIEEETEYATSSGIFARYGFVGELLSPVLNGAQPGAVGGWHFR